MRKIVHQAILAEGIFLYVRKRFGFLWILGRKQEIFGAQNCTSGDFGRRYFPLCPKVFWFPSDFGKGTEFGVQNCTSGDFS